jgi:hypothetical protein
MMQSFMAVPRWALLVSWIPLWGSAAYAQTASSGGGTAAAVTSLQSVTVSTEYASKKGVLSAIRGSKKRCHEDDVFAKSALASQAIALAQCSYHVVVKEGRVRATPDSGLQPPVINIYDISQLQCKRGDAVAQLMGKLATIKYLSTPVPAYEQPVTGYLFRSGDRLMLIGHYGLASGSADMSAKVEALIDQVKQGRYD